LKGHSHTQELVNAKIEHPEGFMTAPAVTSVRAGDRDRERTAGQLGQALSQGYLAMDEYENRLRATFAAHTNAELRQLVADLPLAQLRRNDPQRQAARRRAARLGVRIHLGAYLAMVVIVLTVWLAVGLTAGAWYFWPIWPILGAGIGVVSHAVPVRFAGPGLCQKRPAVDGGRQFDSVW
jgi:Domain of unknown function (DUF1707)/2TM domain